MTSARRTFLRGAAAALLIAACAAAICDYGIASAAAGRIAEDPADVPPCHAALVLGTARTLADGRPNRLYHTRIAAAAALWHAGKVEHVLVSGDNSRRDYDEPSLMREDLIAAGVPEDRITRDFAGFRTLDSVVRSRAVFAARSLCIVSQDVHAARALWLADRAGIPACALAADHVRGWGFVRLRLREIAARTAAVGDALIGRGPHFLGRIEPLGDVSVR